ncbi:MAG: hypothetical protein OXF95_10810 [Rhodobacteraceae bacterium]|nr:hypothetical protein [Paracoccaceae bacterium]
MDFKYEFGYNEVTDKTINPAIPSGQPGDGSNALGSRFVNFNTTEHAADYVW